MPPSTWRRSHASPAFRLTTSTVYSGLLGETINETRRRLRLHRAAVDLLDRDLPIERVARRASADMNRLRRALILSLTSVLPACSEPESRLRADPAQSAGTGRTLSFEDEAAEYLRTFPYQVTYDLTVRYTGGDPAMLNRWVWAQPALVKAGEDVVPHTNNDTYYKSRPFRSPIPPPGRAENPGGSFPTCTTPPARSTGGERLPLMELVTQ